MARTPFIITVDTEGDNLWARPREITTRNAAFLPRFQELCESFNFKPVYLTNYEMAIAEDFVEFARDAVSRDACEIGMHLHAWNSPPLEPLTRDDFFHQPYLTEYPDRVMREKIHVMTELLEERFNRKMISHRAGRWAFDGRYARMLIDEGYLVDCSVTPGVDWRANTGDENGQGGSNYTAFPEIPYFLNPEDISMESSGALLEVPMTVRTSRLFRISPRAYRIPGVNRIARKISPSRRWLCPVPLLEKHNDKAMLSVARAMRDEVPTHAEFMLHSSELMPGGSPNFATPSDIDRLYDQLEALFEELAPWCYGLTLREFRDLWIQLSGHTGMRAFAHQQPAYIGAAASASASGARAMRVGKQAIPE